MSRFHVHLNVNDVAASVAFYTRLFGQAPTVQKDDYAKWMLDDPKVNFAISNHGAAGVDHVGIQAETPEELSAIEARLDAAGLAHISEPGTTCCYARSDKHWTLDPQGLPWEAFYTLNSAPTFNDKPANAAGGCGRVVDQLKQCC